MFQVLFRTPSKLALLVYLGSPVFIYQEFEVVVQCDGHKGGTLTVALTRSVPGAVGAVLIRTGRKESKQDGKDLGCGHGSSPFAGRIA